MTSLAIASSASFDEENSQLPSPMEVAPGSPEVFKFPPTPTGSSRPVKRGDPANSPKPVAKARPHTAWMFTCFFEKDSDRRTLDFQFIYDDTPEVIFIAGQLEECPDTNRLHVQGYIIVTPRLAMKKVKSFFDPMKPHLEPRRGSHEQALAYVTKEDTSVSEEDGGFRFQFGKAAVGSGQRMDLKQVIDHLYTSSLGRPSFDRFVYQEALRLYTLLGIPDPTFARVLTFFDRYEKIRIDFQRN